MASSRVFNPDPLWCSQEGSPPRPPTVLYLVQTSLSPSGRERREAARRSWAAGGALPAGQRAVFVSGRRRAAAPGAGAGAAASGEGEGDLVVTEVEEGDPDFGVKQVAAAMAWVYSRWDIPKLQIFEVYVIAGHGPLEFWGLGGGLLHKVCTLLQWDPEAGVCVCSKP